MGCRRAPWVRKKSLFDSILTAVVLQKARGGLLTTVSIVRLFGELPSLRRAIDDSGLSTVSER